MSVIKIQGKDDAALGIYYEFDPSEPPLGEGGMGRVYKGVMVQAGKGPIREVAIKFMYSDLPEQVMKRAQREASIHIKHKNLVEMFGFIETETRGEFGSVERHFHVVSELLDGVTLAELLKGKYTNKKGEIIPAAEKLYNDFKNRPNVFAINIIRNVLSGVLALHDSGYIHRDIDPTNIMITSSGDIKLIDFGIAKNLHKLKTVDQNLSTDGVFIGKHEYAAPELVIGDIKDQAEGTDIYALGILLYQCVTGEEPFKGTRQEILNQQRYKKMPLKNIKYPKLRKIIDKATQKLRANRYKSAAEFRVALDTLPVEEKPVNINWKLISIVGASAAVIAGIVLLFALPKTSTDGPIIPDTPNTQVDNMYMACENLKNKETANEGLKMLSRLSDAGNSDATYLLSRLYFLSDSQNDFTPDSITVMRTSSHVAIDNGKAHQLLIEAVNQDKTNYKALFELGCDYYAGDLRDAQYKRDVKEAEKLFNQALEQAQYAGDDYFTEKISTKLKALLGN